MEAVRSNPRGAESLDVFRTSPADDGDKTWESAVSTWRSSVSCIRAGRFGESPGVVGRRPRDARGTVNGSARRRPW
jgi:hypothetical protein